MPGSCDNCHERPPVAHEKLEYVTLNNMRRVRSTQMRRVCESCANSISDRMPKGGSPWAVVEALRAFSFNTDDDSAAHWKRVEDAMQPFLAMGIQEHLPWDLDDAPV